MRQSRRSRGAVEVFARTPGPPSRSERRPGGGSSLGAAEEAAFKWSSRSSRRRRLAASGQSATGPREAWPATLTASSRARLLTNGWQQDEDVTCVLGHIYSHGAQTSGCQSHLTWLPPLLSSPPPPPPKVDGDNGTRSPPAATRVSCSPMTPATRAQTNYFLLIPLRSELSNERRCVDVATETKKIGLALLAQWFSCYSRSDNNATYRCRFGLKCVRLVGAARFDCRSAREQTNPIDHVSNESATLPPHIRLPTSRPIGRQAACSLGSLPARKWPDPDGEMAIVCDERAAVVAVDWRRRRRRRKSSHGSSSIDDLNVRIQGHSRFPAAGLAVLSDSEALAPA